MSKKILSRKVIIYNLNGPLGAFLFHATNELGCVKISLLWKETLGPFVILNASFLEAVLYPGVCAYSLKCFSSAGSSVT